MFKDRTSKTYFCLIIWVLILGFLPITSAVSQSFNAPETAFSPNGGAEELVIKAIKSAKKSVHVAAYSFTSRPIVTALLEQKRTGIDVDIVVDHDQTDPRNHSFAPTIAAEGVPVRVDVIHTLMHDKYMVIDGETVETGSFNYTAAAAKRNAENVIVIWNDPKLAAAYAANWQNLWDKAENYRW